jgi:hypothetical protein
MSTETQNELSSWLAATACVPDFQLPARRKLQRAPGSQRGIPQVPPVLHELAAEAVSPLRLPPAFPVPNTDQPFFTCVPPQ